jgi:hypothetical protein
VFVHFSINQNFNFWYFRVKVRLWGFQSFVFKGLNFRLLGFRAVVVVELLAFGYNGNPGHEVTWSYLNARDCSDLPLLIPNCKARHSNLV